MVRRHLVGICNYLILFVIATDDGHVGHAVGSEDERLHLPLGKVAKVHHGGGIGAESHEENLPHHASLRCQQWLPSLVGDLSLQSDKFLAHHLTGAEHVGTPVKLHPHERKTL